MSLGEKEIGTIWRLDKKLPFLLNIANRSVTWHCKNFVKESSDFWFEKAFIALKQKQENAWDCVTHTAWVRKLVQLSISYFPSRPPQSLSIPSNKNTQIHTNTLNIWTQKNANTDMLKISHNLSTFYIDTSPMIKANISHGRILKSL